MSRFSIACNNVPWNFICNNEKFSSQQIRKKDKKNIIDEENLTFWESIQLIWSATVLCVMVVYTKYCRLEVEQRLVYFFILSK